MSTVRVGNRLPPALLDARVLDAHGVASTLGDHVQGATLLFFLRPFGCIGCNQQIGRLLPRLRELRSVGVDALLVGIGPPAHITAYLERAGARVDEIDAVTDPTCSAHRAAGFARSVWATIGLRAWWGKLRAHGEGYRGGPISGEVYQQGGVLLVDRSERVVFRHEDATAAESADVSDVVDAALRIGVFQAREQGAYVL